MARALDMVRAESTYTFGSLVKASFCIDLRFWNPIANRSFQIAWYTFILQPGDPSGAYGVRMGDTAPQTAQNIADCINGTGELGVQYSATHAVYVNQPAIEVTAFHDGIGYLWITAKAYGVSALFVDGMTADLQIPAGQNLLTGERGMVEDDYVRIGSHNYRFIAEMTEQEDRVLLEHSLGDEENVTVMRDRLVEAVQAVEGNSHAGVNYAVATQTHKTVVVDPVGDDAIRIRAITPGLSGNEIELKDSGDGAFSNGAYLSGGLGDFQDWVLDFVRVNELKSSVVEELKRVLVRD